MTEQQDKTNVTPDPKHITAKDYYDYMMDGGDFDFFGAVKKQHEESDKRNNRKSLRRNKNLNGNLNQLNYQHNRQL